MQRSSAVLIGVVIVVIVIIGAFLFLSQAASQAPASPSVSATARAEPSASASLAVNLLDRRWTVLYAGTDLNQRRAEDGLAPNTDALMLVSLSADQSELTMVSLPRDTVDVPLPDGGVYESKINGLYTERGMDALVGAMEELFGVPIDAHVLLDMDDVASLIKAVGGVEVSPDEPLVDPIVSLDLEAGTQDLDAPQAMGYVRSRVDQDYGRMARQQEVLVALVERLVDPETDADLRSLLDGLDSLETDLPLDELPTLVALARAATDADVTTLVIQPPLITFEGDRGDGRGYVLEPDVEAIRDQVSGLIGE